MKVLLILRDILIFIIGLITCPIWAIFAIIIVLKSPQTHGTVEEEMFGFGGKDSENN